MGPSGVYYNQDSDELFVLECANEVRYDVFKDETLGRIYWLSDYRYTRFKTAMAGMENSVKIGEF